MQIRPIQLTEVIYNAATQSFESLVTVHDGDRSRKYACAIAAPITMSFENAADGLARQALRRHKNNKDLYSEIKYQMPVPRAGRQRFDPRRWLENLLASPGRHAA